MVGGPAILTQHCCNQVQREIDIFSTSSVYVFSSLTNIHIHASLLWSTLIYKNGLQISTTYTPLFAINIFVNKYLFYKNPLVDPSRFRSPTCAPLQLTNIQA